MADSRPDSDLDRAATDRPPPRPRWVKVSLIIVLLLILAFVILRLTGFGGEHGPGRHMSPGGAQTPASDMTEHRPPPGVPNHGG